MLGGILGILKPCDMEDKSYDALPRNKYRKQIVKVMHLH